MVTALLRGAALPALGDGQVIEDLVGGAARRLGEGRRIARVRSRAGAGGRAERAGGRGRSRLDNARGEGKLGDKGEKLHLRDALREAERHFVHLRVVIGLECRSG